MNKTEEILTKAVKKLREREILRIIEEYCQEQRKKLEDDE